MQMKKFVEQFDKTILGGVLTRLYFSRRGNKNFKHQIQKLNHSFSVQYQKNDESFLNVLADKYGTDKGEVSSESNPYYWPSHSYTDFYSLIFGLRRNDVKSVVECGLGNFNTTLAASMDARGGPGASLKMWRDYFPAASIIGCDIDSSILFSEQRIKTFYCDQTSAESIKKFLQNAEIASGSVDVIIDDGLHEFDAGVCFFENMIRCLSSDGVYIIEDVKHSDMVKYKNYFCENSASFETRFIFMKSPLRYWGDDNNLICITKK